MTAADVAVAILLREGVTHAFGVPGAAINPFYAAMRRAGGIDHVLARHVEGASHMADGYSRARAGAIGVCVGTSGPAGTDMITGLYAAAADSVPMLAITGQDDLDGHELPLKRFTTADGGTFDVGLIGVRSTGEVRHRRPRSHVLGIATELLEPERPVGAAEDVDTSKPIRGLPTGNNKPAWIKARGHNRDPTAGQQDHTTDISASTCEESP